MTKRNSGSFEVSFYKNNLGQSFAHIEETSVDLTRRLRFDVPLSGIGRNKAFKKIRKKLRQGGYVRFSVRERIYSDETRLRMRQDSLNFNKYF